MLNIELVRAIFIFYNVLQFRVPRSISFRVILQKHTHTHTNTHTDSNEYPIVAFSKNATITREPLSKADSRTGLIAFHIQLPKM